MPTNFPVQMPSGRMEEQPFLSPAELSAKLLRVSRKTVYRRVESGAWPHTRVVSQVYFSPADVAAIMAAARYTPRRTWGPNNVPARVSGTGAPVRARRQGRPVRDDDYRGARQARVARMGRPGAATWAANNPEQLAALGFQGSCPKPPPRRGRPGIRPPNAGPVSTRPPRRSSRPVLYSRRMRTTGRYRARRRFPRPVGRAAGAHRIHGVSTMTRGFRTPGGSTRWRISATATGGCSTTKPAGYIGKWCCNSPDIAAARITWTGKPTGRCPTLTDAAWCRFARTGGT
jgi:hypothetical protein